MRLFLLMGIDGFEHPLFWKSGGKSEWGKNSVCGKLAIMTLISFLKNYHLNLTNRGTFQPTGSKSSPLGKGVTYPTSRLTGHFEKSSVQMYVKNNHKRKKHRIIMYALMGISILWCTHLDTCIQRYLWLLLVTGNPSKLPFLKNKFFKKEISWKKVTFPVLFAKN